LTSTSNIGNYYATASSPTRPTFAQSVLTNISDYYPSPAGSAEGVGRKIFENSYPIYCDNTTEFERDINTYTDTEVSTYSYSPTLNYSACTGFLTVPVGDYEFMTSTSKGVRTIYNPYTQYDYSNPSSIDWETPTFVDATQSGTVTLNYTVPPTQTDVKGHLIVPIMKETAVNQFYTRAGPFQNRSPQSDTSASTINQVLYVPAGTSFQVKNLTTRVVDTTKSRGFVILPIGDVIYNAGIYSSSEADRYYNSYPYVRDENDTWVMMPTTSIFEQMLTIIAGSKKPYFWKPIYKEYFFYKSSLTSYLIDYNTGGFNVIKHPTGRYEQMGGGGSGKGAQGQILSRQEDTSFDPYPPPPPPPPLPGTTDFDPYAPPHTQVPPKSNNLTQRLPE